MILVFIAGPYTAGDVAQNVKAAIDTANVLMDARFAVFVPHLSHFQHLVHPREYESWTANDNEVLARCDVVLRLPGESPGADAEVALARKLGKPVATSLADLMAMRAAAKRIAEDWQDWALDQLRALVDGEGEPC